MLPLCSKRWGGGRPLFLSLTASCDPSPHDETNTAIGGELGEGVGGNYPVLLVTRRKPKFLLLKLLPNPPALAFLMPESPWGCFLCHRFSRQELLFCNVS